VTGESAAVISGPSPLSGALFEFAHHPALQPPPANLLPPIPKPAAGAIKNPSQAE